jgi:fatty-acyl-CoA synthase
VVVKDGAQVRPEELGEFLATKFAKWQLPDGFVFSDELPRTSVGKLAEAEAAGDVCGLELGRLS